MNFLTRLVGYSVLLLLLFLAASLGAQAWLRQQTVRLRVDAIEAKRAQFLALTSAGTWRPADADRLGAMVGGKVSLRAPGTVGPTTDAGVLFFDQLINDGTTLARVSFTASPLTRLVATYQRVTVGLLVFGFALLALAVGFTALHRRGGGPEPENTLTRGPTRAEVGSLAQLAESSAAQRIELTRERDVRRLAEEDALLKQKLLNQSLEGKVRLGHDLHDGIIQSLYAAGLTIESARATVHNNPHEADRVLAKCVQHINATIRDVRSYISGLAPGHLHQASFTQAIESLVTELGAGRAVKLDLKVDEEASGALSSEHIAEMLQIARESISNSLRHGGASFVTVRLHRIDREICLLVQDNGTGFDPERAKSSGFGLNNMKARAARIGAVVLVESKPASGTRVVLTLPL